MGYLTGVAVPDPRLEQDLQRYAREVSEALGRELVSIVLYGSAAGGDWIAGRSDVNTAVVVRHVTAAVLEALVPIVARWRPEGFALPLVVDPDFLARSCDVFPMEIEDIRHQHHIIAGSDPFAQLAPDLGALRREYEVEARGKLLRLRALYLEHANDGPALERLLVDSCKTFLVLLRHLLRIRGVDPAPAYAGVLSAAEAVFGPLPALRRTFALRDGTGDASALRTLFVDYLADVEHIVDVADRLRV